MQAFAPGSLAAPLARDRNAVASSPFAHCESSERACVCMACRTNLKKDKRLRNRANAFRFKKPTSRFTRFNNNNAKEDQAKQTAQQAPPATT